MNELQRYEFDPDKFRKTLKVFEGLRGGRYLTSSFLDPATAEVGIDKDEFRYYLPLATDRGFIATIEGPNNIKGHRLTWDGLQFLQETGSPAMWEKFKEVAKSHGFDIAREAIIFFGKEMAQKLPM